MWDLIVSVPDHCLSFYLSLSIQQKSSVESMLIFDRHGPVVHIIEHINV